ncbi:MAG: hypothetical protein ACI9DC_004319 [Gammaproteobacteria bacterium]|jgi:hypothetical protein
MISAAGEIPFFCHISPAPAPKPVEMGARRWFPMALSLNRIVKVQEAEMTSKSCAADVFRGLWRCALDCIAAGALCALVLMFAVRLLV